MAIGLSGDTKQAVCWLSTLVNQPIRSLIFIVLSQDTYRRGTRRYPWSLSKSRVNILNRIVPVA